MKIYLKDVCHVEFEVIYMCGKKKGLPTTVSTAAREKNLNLGLENAYRR